MTGPFRRRGLSPVLRRRGAAGFTLVEIIIAVAVTGVALALLYKIFGSFYRTWVAEGLKSDMRQNARVALDTVTKDFEMTGYHTTQYGDPKKANLAVTIARTTLAEEIAGDGLGDDDGVCEAGEACRPVESEIEVDQHWLDIATGTYQPRMVYYHLAADASGRRNLYRQVRTQPGAAAANEIIAENVEKFAVRYYDTDGAEIVPPLPGGYFYTPGSDPPQQLREIRRICVEVGTKPNRVHSWMQMNAPSGAVVDPSFELGDCVSPRNLTVEEIAIDTTPPCVPANLAVVDSRSCTEKLCVRWDKCSDPDLDGYTVHYGAAGTLKLPLGLLADPDNPQVYLSMNDVLITKSADRTTAPNTYVVSVSAYDSMGNQSGRSTPVSGNPDPDVSDCAAGSGDTTVNPAPPSAPLSFSVRADASLESVLAMGWAPPADGSATVGYRLYRGEDPFVSGANIDPNAAGVVRLADETTLDSGTFSYVDADPALEACRTYSYAVASVNCDETLVPTYLYNSIGGGDYGAGTAEPQDWTPPPAASLEGTTAGWQRVFISLQNPTEEDAPDFDRTEIWFNPGNNCPTITGGGNISSGQLIPDSDSGTPGTFTSRGSQTIVFDSESDANPSAPELTNQGEYCLLAVTYDGCGNTAVDSTSLVLIELCGDDPAGPPPDWPENPTYRSCDPKWINLTWEYPPKYWTGGSQVFDFAGYRIWRHTRESGGVSELTTGPTWSESWQDAKDIQEGEGYRYEVRATDCVYENRNAEFPNNYSAPLYIPSDSGWISPGRLDLFPGDGGNPFLARNFVTSYSDSAEPLTYHNNVQFFIHNTGRSTMDIERMRILWENGNAVLDRITVGGPPSSTGVNVRPTGGVPPGTAVSVNVTIDDTATGINSPSGPVPIQLRFTNTDGSVNDLTDMRGERLAVELQFRNNSLQGSTCDPEIFIVAVPRGPQLSGFVQEAKRPAPIPPGALCPDYRPSLEVPGAPPGAGTAREDDLEAPAVTDVNVLGTVQDTSGPLFDFVDGIGLGTPRGYSTLSLYYLDASLATGVPALPTGTFTEIPLRNLGGDGWGIYDDAASAGSKIPDFSDRALWYYLVAVDRSGNFTRYPDHDLGAFAYYQAAHDVCAANLKPRPPVLTGAKSAGTVTLAWTEPALYADCGTIPVTDTLGYNLYVTDSSATVSLLCGDDPDFPPASACPSASPFTYDHTPGDLDSESYLYTVKAANSCSDGDGPRASDYSNAVEEDLL